MARRLRRADVAQFGQSSGFQTRVPQVRILSSVLMNIAWLPVLALMWALGGFTTALLAAWQEEPYGLAAGATAVLLGGVLALLNLKDDR